MGSERRRWVIVKQKVYYACSGSQRNREKNRTGCFCNTPGKMWHFMHWVLAPPMTNSTSCMKTPPGGLKCCRAFAWWRPEKLSLILATRLSGLFFLHGEQTIWLFRPFSPEGKVIQTGEVKHIYDKGKGAVYHIHITGRTGKGDRLYDAEWVIFYVGAGGFGGDPGPGTEALDPPTGVKPDFSLSYKVAEKSSCFVPAQRRLEIRFISTRPPRNGVDLTGRYYTVCVRMDSPPGRLLTAS